MTTTTTKREIAFIDRHVDDLETLLAGIRPDVEPILLSDDEPAPRQMARAVQGREGLEAIHVIAHGRPGEVCFGAGSLSLETVSVYSTDLARIGQALRSDGDLLLWSCETGQGKRGATFQNAMAHAVGANTGAASGIVGHAARGGQCVVESSH